MSRFRGNGKWKPEGPTRTNTGSSIRGKISAPIPIDDDEFPIRLPGTGIATPLGSEGVQESLQGRGSVVSGPDSHGHKEESIVTDSVDQSRTTRAILISNRPSDELSGRYINQPSTLRVSMRSVPSGHSEEKPQRKKSSLRSVLSRLFGKKRKSGSSVSVSGQNSDGLRAGQHFSDPSALGRSPKGTKSFSPQRSASLPINEFNRALRSHSIDPDGFPLDTTPETNRESIQADGHGRPRRATTPSRLYTPNTRPGYVDWVGLSPRPASSHARGSGPISNEDDTEAIGYAVTSGSHPNRRSRSLSHLRETATIQNVSRRRSDEIRYWRESYDPGALSPMSSNKPEAEEPLSLDQPEIPQRGEPLEQPQPFNFGPIGELAGMKITQAASLETRVSRLEERMLEVEKAVSGIHHANIGDPLLAQELPKGVPERVHGNSPNWRNMERSDASPKQQRYRERQQYQQVQGSAPNGSQMRSSSYGSSRPSTTSTNNSYRHSVDHSSSPILQSPDTSHTSSQCTARPLSTSTTIRGFPTSSPVIPKDAVLTADHYATLTNMILAEKSARQQLEAVVQSLQQQLHAVLSGTVSYPTHGPYHEEESLEIGADGGGEFSSFEHDYSSDDEGRYEQEDFMTPREERAHFGDEVFGGGINKGGELKSSAPRTLSLSQMTLKSGPGIQASVNF